MRPTHAFYKRAQQQRLRADIEAFLAAGGRIRYFPAEASAVRKARSTDVPRGTSPAAQEEDTA